MSTPDFTDACDYCTQPLPKIAYLRAVGFTEWEAVASPLVKAWCGLCLTDDDIDPAAAERASWMSPNPGGVGPMTRAMLLVNVVTAAERLAQQG